MRNPVLTDEAFSDFVTWMPKVYSTNLACQCITYSSYGIYYIKVLYAAFVAPYEGVELREYPYVVQT